MESWYVICLVLGFWVLVFTLYEKRKEVGSYKKIQASLLTVVILVVIGVVAGGLGYKVFIEKPPKEEAADTGLLCKAKVRKGKIGDVRSEYFISENHSCDKYIDYKDMPEDTEIIQVD